MAREFAYNTKAAWRSIPNHNNTLTFFSSSIWNQQRPWDLNNKQPRIWSRNYSNCNCSYHLHPFWKESLCGHSKIVLLEGLLQQKRKQLPFQLHKRRLVFLFKKKLAFQIWMSWQFMTKILRQNNRAALFLSFCMMWHPFKFDIISFFVPSSSLYLVAASKLHFEWIAAAISIQSPGKNRQKSQAELFFRQR